MPDYQLYVKTTGALIIGTLENITGRAEIGSVVPAAPGVEPEINWEGGTEIFWDGQMTARDDKGRKIYLDRDGNEYTIDALEVREEEARK